MPKRLIVVVGATGNQGCSVMNELLNNGFEVRGVARDIETPMCDEARRRGAEFVPFDISTEDHLKRIFRDADGVFIVTDWFDKSIGHKEETILKRLIKAAKSEGLNQIILSCGPDTNKLSDGKYKIEFFDLKARAADYLRHLQKSKNAFRSVSFFYPAFYYQNFNDILSPRIERNEYIFTLPRLEHLVAFDVRDTGRYVVPAFLEPEKYNLKNIYACGFNGGMDELIESIHSTLNIPVGVKWVEPGEFETESRQVTEMFKWIDEYGFFGPDEKLKHAAEQVKARRFGEFLRDGKLRLPQEGGAE